ncbi:heavy metal-associated isoprenylated plant protein 47-like [Miscanthus floridulus]|uniref:heavy metal-associated isoprenylated plant protein 47-like n=1 Tax=Miscanthus floridulus TaxID=154761 RepID=UPI003458D12C
MKQKIVIRVQMECDRCRSKALALVAATGGVDSVSLAGDGRDQVVVVGDDVDSVKLTNALRRKVGSAEIVQVAEAKKEGGGGDNPPAATATALPEFVVSSPWYYQQYPQPTAVVYEHPAEGGTAKSIGSMLFSSATCLCCSGVTCICLGGCSSDGGGRSM